MQKLNKKASILLWSIFLSMTIIIAFTSINFQLKQSLSENSSLMTKIEENNNKFLRIHNAIKSNNFSDIELNKIDKLIFEWDNIINQALKKNEKLELKIAYDKEQSDKTSNLTIKINNWWPILYKNTKIEGIIKKELTFNTKEEQISIENLWWYSDITITSEKKFENKIKKYKIVSNYWTRVSLKEAWKITIN